MLEVDKDAKKIIDIFRGTYLQTQTKLDLHRLGQFWLGIEIPNVGHFAIWEVYPLPSRNAIISEVTLGREATFWAIDSWGTA